MSLDGRQKLALEATELLGGAPPPQDSYIRVLSSSPIEAFGLLAKRLGGGLAVDDRIHCRILVAARGSHVSLPDQGHVLYVLVSNSILPGCLTIAARAVARAEFHTVLF